MKTKEFQTSLVPESVTESDFSLYAAVFNVVDRQQDVLMSGCFQNLDEFVAAGWGTVNHDRKFSLGVATVTKAEQDSYGLLVHGKWHTSDEAKEVRTVIKERADRGKKVSASIGFQPIEERMEVIGGSKVNVIKKANIYEFSFVCVGANRQAGLVSVKGMPTPSAVISALQAMTKEGRVLSRANIETIDSWAARCRGWSLEYAALADEMSSLCDQFRGRKEEDAGNDNGTDQAESDRLEKRARLIGLRLRQRAPQPSAFWDKQCVD